MSNSPKFSKLNWLLQCHLLLFLFAFNCVFVDLKYFISKIKNYKKGGAKSCGSSLACAIYFGCNRSVLSILFEWASVLMSFFSVSSPKILKRDCNHSLCVGKQTQRRTSVSSDAGGTGNYRRIAMLERAGAAPMRKVGEESYLGPHAARIQTFYCV